MGCPVGSWRTILRATSSMAGSYPCSALPMNAGVTLRRTVVWSSLAHHSMIRLPKTISCGANRRRPVPNDKARFFSCKTARTSSGDEVQNIVGKSGTSNVNRSPSAASCCRAVSGAKNNLAHAAREIFGRGRVSSAVTGRVVGVVVLIATPCEWSSGLMSPIVPYRTLVLASCSL